MNAVFTFTPMIPPVGLPHLGRDRWDWISDPAMQIPTVEELRAKWDRMCMDHLERSLAAIEQPRSFQ